MRKPSKQEFLRLNNIVPAARVKRTSSRKRPPRKTKMYADAISMKENMKGTAILVNGRRIKAVDGVWYLEGHWMIVWDANREPYLRKVVCVLPKNLEVMFPVYAFNETGSSAHCCWLHAGEIPKGLDVSGIDGWYEMKKDLKL